MLSESTARLVERSVVLGERKLVRSRISTHRSTPDGSCRSAIARPPRRKTNRSRRPHLGTEHHHGDSRQAINGAGLRRRRRRAAGIGKSRLAREATAVAAARGCRRVRHLVRIPHQRRLFPRGGGVVARDVGRRGLDSRPPCARIRTGSPMPTRGSAPVRDCGHPGPGQRGARDRRRCRRRRLTAMINAASLARRSGGLGHRGCALDRRVQRVDARRLVPIIPQTHALVLITYRPEYQGD